MKHLFLTGTIGLVALGAVAQDAPDNHQAQAGTRVGRVFIGDSRVAVGRRLGAPTKTFDLGHGLISQLWRGKKPGDTGNRNTLEVVYQNGLVRQIEATSLVFKTASGLSLSSSRADWEDKLGKPLVGTYDFDNGNTKRYLDWKSKGISLELIAAPDSDGPTNWTYQTLIVHKKGVPVVPDQGGTRQ